MGVLIIVSLLILISTIRRIKMERSKNSRRVNLLNYSGLWIKSLSDLRIP